MSKKHSKAEQYHAENPQVYARLKKLAYDEKRLGATRLSISRLFELLRFEVISKRTGELFSISNEYKPFYSRLLMEKNSGLAGMFITKS